jgi:hypothetical protein
MSEEIGRREFIKRGTIAGVAATTAMPLAARVAGATTVRTTGTTTGVATSSDVASPAFAARRLDSKEFCLSEYDALKPALSFSATTPNAARRWQQRARPKLIDRLGGFPSQRSPLNAEVLETKDLGGYTRE